MQYNSTINVSFVISLDVVKLIEKDDFESKSGPF